MPVEVPLPRSAGSGAAGHDGATPEPPEGEAIPPEGREEQAEDGEVQGCKHAVAEDSKAWR